jgi:hypothetical protein
VGRMWLATRVVAKKLLQRRRWMKVLYSYCCTHVLWMKVLYSYCCTHTAVLMYCTHSSVLMYCTHVLYSCTVLMYCTHVLYSYCCIHVLYSYTILTHYPHTPYTIHYAPIVTKLHRPIAFIRMQRMMQRKRDAAIAAQKWARRFLARRLLLMRRNGTVY